MSFTVPKLKFQLSAIKLRGVLFWKFMPGVKIKVRWPVGWTQPDHLGNQTKSADPNDHYRPWMEKYVGRQYLDWGWELEDDDINTNSITIKFRKGKTKWATMASMRWA